MDRLQKILAHAGVASRRASERLIVDGRVTVNGITIRELGTKADPARDEIRVDGRRVGAAERHRYLLLHKPKGYVTTRSDPQKRPTVLDLLGGMAGYVYPVGRLDFDSEGLLLLTNDGDLAARLTHPRHGVPRIYEATVLGVPDAHDLDRLRRGVPIEGRRTGPAEVRILTEQTRKTDTPKIRSVVRITIREGRNRQVRKMFEAIGHPVDRLIRVGIGRLRDARLGPGKWRDLTAAEVASLQKDTDGTPEVPGAGPPHQPTAERQRSVNRAARRRR
jgi:23S rRNA pseudouridine2605 synthase